MVELFLSNLLIELSFPLFLMTRSIKCTDVQKLILLAYLFALYIFFLGNSIPSALSGFDVESGG